MSVDLSTDYLTVDLKEAVTLNSRTNSGNNTLAVTHAFRGELTTKEQHATGGIAVRLEAAYDVPLTLISSYTWKPGDTLTDSLGNVLNIYSASRDAAWWRFLVYNPTIAYDLRHEIDVYDLKMDKDNAGATYVAVEELIYESISSRVQWVSGRPSTVNKRTGETHKAVIYLSQRLYLKNNYLIRWADDTQDKLWEFDVIEWSMPDRLDELMQVSVEARP